MRRVDPQRCAVAALATIVAVTQFTLMAACTMTMAPTPVAPAAAALEATLAPAAAARHDAGRTMEPAHWGDD